MGGNSPSLLYSIPREGLYALHVVAIIALFVLVNLLRVPLTVRVFVTMALVLLAFFLSQRWQVDRNVLVVPAILLWASCHLFAGLEAWLPRGLRWGVITAGVLLAAYVLPQDAARVMPQPDFRTGFAREQQLAKVCDEALIADVNLQWHEATVPGLDVIYVRNRAELAAALRNTPAERCVLLSERLTEAAAARDDLSLVMRRDGPPIPQGYTPQSQYLWRAMPIYWFKKTD